MSRGVNLGYWGGGGRDVLRTSGADPAFDPEGIFTTSVITLINCINLEQKLLDTYDVLIIY